MVFSLLSNNPGSNVICLSDGEVAGYCDFFNPFKILSLCICSLNPLICHSIHLSTDPADNNHSKLFASLLSYSAVLNEIQPYSP